MSDWLKSLQETINANPKGSIKLKINNNEYGSIGGENVERIEAQAEEMADGELIKLVFHRPMKGFEGRHEMKLDWTEEFIEDLRRAGYTGTTDDIIVAKWLRQLSNDIAADLDSTDYEGNQHI